MEGPLWRLVISSWSVNKHGRHRQFLFLIGPFLKKSSPLKPFDQMKQNLVGSIYGRSSIVFAHFIPMRQQTWPPQTILVSDWSISSPLKPHIQMNRNLVGSIYGRSSIMIAHIVTICLQRWLPQAILVFDWLISKKLFFSEAK